MDWIDKLMDREDLKLLAKKLNEILADNNLTEYEKHYVLRTLDSAIEYSNLFPKGVPGHE